MEQYIDKAAVVAEIKARIETYNKGYANGDDCRADALETFLHDIDFLEVKEDVVSTDTPYPNSLKISRNGNPRIEAMKEALRMEYEKGRADVLRCIDPDEMVADFCSQPLSKTRSLASIYRQGIMDILKRINNNEKTSINSTHSIDDCGL